MAQLRAPRLVIAEGTAEEVIRDLKLGPLPIDPIKIAEIKDIVVSAKPSDGEGFSGVLARVGESFGIMYATHVRSRGFQRFSVAHELGHYFLPDHVEHVLRNGAHYSHANFVSADPYEQEADLFAAALLMPVKLFKSAMARNADGLIGIRCLAKQCETSITATACRYARFTRDAVAIVQSTDGVVDFCSFSELMKDARVRWLRKGSPVPAGTLTKRLSEDRAAVFAAREASGEADLCDWFDCPESHVVQEEVMGLGGYGRVLTVISSEGIARIAEHDDFGEPTEEELVESWTPRFRR